MAKRQTADSIFTGNLKRLMGWDERTKKTTTPQAFLAKAPTGKVAQATIGRILRGTQSARLETVQAIANHYGTEAWKLLVTDYNPAKEPVLRLTKEREAEFYRKLEELRAIAEGNTQ